MATYLYESTYTGQVNVVYATKGQTGNIRAIREKDRTWTLEMYINSEENIYDCFEKLNTAKNLRELVFPYDERYNKYIDAYAKSRNEMPKRGTSCGKSLKIYIVSTEPAAVVISQYTLPNLNTSLPIFVGVSKEQITMLRKLLDEIKTELAKETARVFPPPEDVFNAFTLTKYSVKVLILGQDPYHGEGQAMGLSFSVRKGKRPPPSLANIYKELANDGFTVDDPKSGDLTKWSTQGVMLLNTALTVRERQPGSHTVLWRKFTDSILNILAKKYPKMAVVMWGNHAQGYQKIFPNHFKVMSTHPSPYSANRFFHTSPFSKVNTYLESIKQSPIDWSL